MSLLRIMKSARFSPSALTKEEITSFRPYLQKRYDTVISGRAFNTVSILDKVFFIVGISSACIFLPYYFMSSFLDYRNGGKRPAQDTEEDSEFPC